MTRHAEPRELEVFRSITRSSPDAVLLVSTRGQIVAATQASEALLGTRCGDLESRQLDDLFREPRATVLTFLGGCASGADPVNGGSIKLRAAATGAEVECRGHQLEPTGNRAEPLLVVRCFEAIPDSERISALVRQVDALRAEVNKRKEIEFTLEAAQARAEAIVETAVDGIVTIDADGIIRTVNGAMVETFGYEPAELIGRNISLLMPAPYCDQHDDYIRTYLQTGVKRIIGIGRVVTGLRKDGSEFPMELKVGEFKAQGEPQFAGFIHDISARRRMEEKLRDREETLRITLEQAPSGIVGIALDGRILSANRAFCRLLESAEEQLVGRYFPELCHADDDVNCKDVTARLIDSRQPSLSFDCRLVPANDRTLHVQMHVAVARNRHGDPSNLIVQIVDRSEERRHAEEAREHRERLAHVTRVMTMGEMAAGIAHEINQPLAAISTYSQACHRLIEAGAFEKAELLRAMSEVTAQAERAGEVIRHLRTMVKQGHTARQVVDLNAVVSEAVRLANMDAQAFETQIELDLSSDIPPVEADIIQVQQVLLNLIRNGIDAMMRGSSENNRIAVATRAYDDDHVAVCVRDSGQGISEDVADKLFKPFFTTKGTGMGMGLAISQAIIRAHEGRLWFERDDGRGTTFCFTLPMALETSSVKPR